ncbi:MAG: hypothetical protein ACLFQK_06220 [Fibrobacterota bacterium]
MPDKKNKKQNNIDSIFTLREFVVVFLSATIIMYLFSVRVKIAQKKQRLTSIENQLEQIYMMQRIFRNEYGRYGLLSEIDFIRDSDLRGIEFKMELSSDTLHYRATIAERPGFDVFNDGIPGNEYLSIDDSHTITKYPTGSDRKDYVPRIPVEPKPSTEPVEKDSIFDFYEIYSDTLNF